MAKEHYTDLEKKYVLYIVSIVLIVEVVALGSLLSSHGNTLGQALSTSNMGGQATMVQAQAATQYMQAGCIDSDNGAHYRTAGYVTYRNGNFYDNCLGSTLNEKYCDYDRQGNLVLKTVNYRCKWGCIEGACY